MSSFVTLFAVRVNDRFDFSDTIERLGLQSRQRFAGGVNMFVRSVLRDMREGQVAKFFRALIIRVLHAQGQAPCYRFLL